jgi:uncharacterized protein
MEGRNNEMAVVNIFAGIDIYFIHIFDAHIENMVKRNALFTFLALTFGITVVLTIAAKSMGLTLVGKPAFMSQIVVLGAMFIPALSAALTQVLVVGHPLRELGFRLGPISMYGKTYLLILGIFCLNYAITWAFVQKPDPSLQSFLDMAGIPGPLPVPPAAMIALFAFATLFVTPVFNLLPCLGEEIGWRGFLLPALEPMGKRWAVVLSGMIWALWHTPMILILGFGYGDQAWPGALLHFVMVTSFGIWIGYAWFRTRSTVLAGFMHATFNANAYGVWALLFVSNDKTAVGAGSVTGMAICLAVGIYFLLKMRKDIKPEINESC